MPTSAPAQPDVHTLQPVLAAVREKIRKLRKFWRQYMIGEAGARKTFAERIGTLREKAAPLGSPHFERLLDTLAEASEKMPDPHPADSDLLLVEMAAAFLVAESIVDTFGEPPADLDDQITLLSAWLLDAANGKPSITPPTGLRPELRQEVDAIQLRAHVAREILANLLKVEEVVDGYARGHGSDKIIQALAPQLRQIRGALTVLRWDRAVTVLERCQALLSTLTPKSADLDWIAEGLSSLGLFITPCLEGREPRAEVIDTFLERFDKRAPAPAPTPEPAAPPSDELLQVFLEEAAEVLDGIDAALANPKAENALADIRRGFHTLKGSGRMVGQSELGEAAWEVEQVMNRWLEEKRPATPELLELAATSTKLFREWTAALRAGKTPQIDPAPITALAQQLKPDVFDIYLKEARSHIATLEAQCSRWCANRGTSAPDEFMRAAHTLASSSRTAGVEAIAGLAAALEQWMPFAGLTVDEADAALVADAVAHLKEMVDAAGNRRAVPLAGETIAALQALATRLQPPRKTKEKRVMRDDLDTELLPVFLQEAAELVPQIAADLRAWKSTPGDSKLADSVKRALHTLKGSARMAGAIRLGELTHLMESRIEFALETGDLSAAVLEDLEAHMDRLSGDLDKLRGGPRPAAIATVAAAAAAAPAAMLRVNAERLDDLIAESGEVAIARSRIEGELRQVKESLSELNESIARLRTQLREVEVQADSQLQSRRSVMVEREAEFDPLEFDRYTRLQELTRMMAEGLNDALSIQQGLAKNLGEADAALSQQARLGRELQQDLMRMRALPFATLSERLHRIVRQSARELGKKAELDIEGSQVELDRSVLERIAAPLEHLIRNSLVHGLEMPSDRAGAGKDETGRISIVLRQEANEIVVLVSDDGAGLDVERLRAKAVEKGLIGSDVALSDAEQLQLVFLSGLSTAESVTELAGRGVGMDVVRSEINAVGGRIELASTRGRGVTFTIYLPLTLAVAHGVLVRAGTTTAAVPSASVEQVLRLKADGLVTLYEKGRVEFQGRDYPLHYLRHLLGERGATDIRDYNSLLLVRSANERVAVHVDELFGNREMVVKSIGPQLSRLAGVMGATVMPDGSIVLIVNPVQLAARRQALPAALETTAGTLPATVAAPIIMVVDDSITVRKITSRLLEREGYRVLTARDGVDALEQLKKERPAVMLIDIEMPRMDGFDLTRNVRGDPRTMEIPIIVISSRTAPKHRSRATELGVNAYLGKPYEEGELLKHVAALAGVREAA
jgi:chemosensory pili system protein ChpA (sensor histidine kinase/response regulator)